MLHGSADLTLVPPTVAHAAAYLEMVADFEAAGEGYPFNDAEGAKHDFAAFVRDLENEAQGIDLPPGIPPQQTYILVKDGQTVVGEIRFRPKLEPPYESYNGHIGYNIRPSFRGQGYATRQLALLLEKARALGLPGVSLTIEGENPASVQVILRNGGSLMRQVSASQSGDQVALYWIELTPHPSDTEGA